ncbi:PREDICTED: protein strawberry notch homolog 1-like isoform X1 [Acropora digitifera]|uniref:protein strawberry notch homolog 1-like isoform X1 n=1 Tax=Acropora digitifera TaxID=70779 RepID=UPI00077AE4FC|nr:PREDICTED: protein strawberry notch homolog 1-like isoform X1 [Acropora digitifera]
MSCTRAQRGMSWKESLELRASKTYPDNGYYLSNQIQAQNKTKPSSWLSACETGRKKKNSIYVSLYGPNTGQQKKQDTFEDAKKKKTK